MSHTVAATPPLTSDAAANTATGNSISVRGDVDTLMPSVVDDGREQPLVESSIHSIPNASRALLSSDVLLASTGAFIRELLENALDSAANNIVITALLQDDGSGALESIEVRDNGRGIAKEEKQLLAQPHCTSKIRRFEDIIAAAYGVQTFGFRGEALHCITGSCALMTIQSKRAGDPVAFKAQWTKGVRGADTTVAQAAAGTCVYIKGLYFNRPVRAMMAKKEAAQEKQRIQELLRSYAFVHPHVRIICNEPAFSKAAATSKPPSVLVGLELFREAIPLVVGTATGLNQMLEFESTSEEDFRVQGFVTRYDVEPSHKELLRSKSDRIFFYITSTRSIALPWLTKALVAEWRVLSTRQLQRRGLRSKGLDPTATVVQGADPSLAERFTSKFPLAVVQLSVPKPESLIDLNRSPDKRDILVGDEVAFRSGMISAVKAALQSAMEKIEQKEQEEFRSKHPAPVAAAEEEQKSNGNTSTSMELHAAPALAAAAVPASPSRNARTPAAAVVRHSPVKIEEDDIEILPSPSLKSAQPAASPSQRTDFSNFAQPIAQPQAFAVARGAPAASAASMPSTPPSPPRPVALTSAVPTPIPTSPARSGPSTPKRARLDSPASSTPPMRQTQISVVDAINSAIPVAPRIIQMNDDLFSQITAGFMQHEAIITARKVPAKPKHIGLLPRPGLCVLQLPDDPPDPFDDPAITSLPTLCAFSTFRADELVMFHQLLTHYSVPSVPLDERIPVDEHFPELSDSEREQLQQDVLEAERLQLEQRVPTGCITFQQAMQLCGFRLHTIEAGLALVAVPSDSSISITDFLATLRRIWSDDCFQRTKLLKLKTSPPTAVGSSQPTDLMAAWSPSTAWRVEGIRRAIMQQASAAAIARQPSYARTSETAELAPLETAFTMKTVDRLRAIVAAGSSDIEGETDWTQLTCTHHKRIAYRITNQRPSNKQE